jgi:hypothetical protein
VHKTCFVYPQNVNVKRAHLQYVDVAICRIASIEDNHMENRFMLHSYWYGCDWWSWSSRTLSCDNPSSCAICCELLHGCCSTAAIMESLLVGCPCNMWVTCIHMCQRCCISCLTETLLQLRKDVWHPDDINQDNVARITMKQYQLNYYGYQGLRVCHNIRRLCVPWAFDLGLPIVLCILSAPNSVLCIMTINKEYVYRFDRYMYHEN